MILESSFALATNRGNTLPAVQSDCISLQFLQKRPPPHTKPDSIPIRNCDRIGLIYCDMFLALRSNTPILICKSLNRSLHTSGNKTPKSLQPKTLTFKPHKSRRSHYNTHVKADNNATSWNSLWNYECIDSSHTVMVTILLWRGVDNCI